MVETIIRDINAVAWGLPMLILLLGTGIYLTAGLGFMTMRKVPRAVSLLFSGVSGRGEGDIGGRREGGGGRFIALQAVRLPLASV